MHVPIKNKSKIIEEFRKVFTIGEDDLLIGWNAEDMTERKEYELANS